MSQPSEPAGPPCDLCQAAPAMGSLMNYGDYSQVKFCPGCAPVFLRGIADTMDPGETGGFEPDNCLGCGHRKDRHPGTDPAECVDETDNGDECPCRRYIAPALAGTGDSATAEAAGDDQPSPKLAPGDCLSCGHSWDQHSFHGPTRSECHYDTGEGQEPCDCIGYAEASPPAIRWADVASGQG